MCLHVQAWVKHRWRLKDKELVPEPANIPLSIEGRLALKDVELIILVGLPGGLHLLCTSCWGKVVHEGSNHAAPALHLHHTVAHSTWHSCCSLALS